MPNNDEKLKKITITRGVVFSREARGIYDVIDVDDSNRSEAENLIRAGKAVAGEVKKPSTETNKVVGGLDRK
jgi:hypothetical protein